MILKQGTIAPDIRLQIEHLFLARCPECSAGVLIELSYR